VKKSSATYRRITKSTAILLLMAFLIPSGLQAKQLVDFCLMEFSSHTSAHTAAIPFDEMEPDHSCCVSNPDDETASDAHSHSACDWGFICACSIGQSQLSDEEWIPVSNDTEIILAKTGDLTPFITSGESIPAGTQIRIGEHDPPLWLLYDTFLM
jgi:hypothetical protein